MRVAVDEGEAYSPAMPSKLKPTEPSEEIPECAQCGKPMPLCICESIEPIANRLELLILQHPQEQDRALGTARLTALQLKKSSLKIGLSWPSLSKALGRDVDPQRWAILYLGSVKLADLETDRDLVAVDRKGALEDGQRGILKDIEGVVLLDGTWSQAKALWWRNAWMLKCQRIVLGPERPSLYGKLRKEPRADGLSTIEAAGMTLGRLEGRTEIETALSETFGRLLARYREVQTTMPELAPKPKKRDYRRPANRRGKSKVASKTSSKAAS